MSDDGKGNKDASKEETFELAPGAPSQHLLNWADISIKVPTPAGSENGSLKEGTIHKTALEKRSDSTKWSSKVDSSKLPAKVCLKINTQRSRFEYINELSQKVENGDLAALEYQLEMVQEVYATFYSLHEELIDAYSSKLMTHSYIQNEIPEKCFKAYLQIKGAITYKLKRNQRKEVTAQPPKESSHLRRQLPEISLPIFLGNYSAWTPFKDLFISMVGSNQEISSVEKMHYLRTCLSSEALQLIANLPVSRDSFSSAWDILTSRYVNKRLLISSYLDQLFYSPQQRKLSTL